MTGTERVLQVGGRRLEVRVPPGVRDGQRIRLSGKADGGGDIYLTVAVEPHPAFTRDGANLSRELPLTLGEALLGGEVPVETIAGSALLLRSRPGRRTGRMFRLKGQGLPRVGRATGAATCSCATRVVLPTHLDDEGRRARQSLRRLRRPARSTRRHDAARARAPCNIGRIPHEARSLHPEGPGGHPRRPAAGHACREPRARRRAHPRRAARGRPRASRPWSCASSAPTRPRSRWRSRAVLGAARPGGRRPAQPRPARQALLERAEDEAKRLGDEYVSTEHLLLASSEAGGDAQRILESAGAGHEAIVDALAVGARQPARHLARPRGHLPGARAVRPRPDRGRARGQARPGRRARRGDPPRHPGAEPADEEQPGAHRRARRRARPPSPRASRSASSAATCPRA